MNDLVWLLLIVGIPWGLIFFDEEKLHKYHKACNNMMEHSKKFTCAAIRKGEP